MGEAVVFSELLKSIGGKLQPVDGHYHIWDAMGSKDTFDGSSASQFM